MEFLGQPGPQNPKDLAIDVDERRGKEQQAANEPSVMGASSPRAIGGGWRGLAFVLGCRRHDRSRPSYFFPAFSSPKSPVRNFALGTDHINASPGYHLVNF